jgi:hypothetical protein
MIDYVIVSYNRPDIIKKRTLNMLKKNSIPNDRIYIVVANKEQEVIYRAKNPDYKIVVGQKGIVQVRNFVRRKWNGKKICMMDDDIKSVKQYLDKGKWGQLRNITQLDKLMTKGFELLDKHGGRLIHISTGSNTRSMSEDIHAGLVIPAMIWGEICDGKIQMKNECSNIEDTLIGLAYWKKYGKGGISFNGIATGGAIEVGLIDGGNQSKGSMDRTDKAVMDCQMKMIIKPWSNLIASYKVKKFPTGNTDYGIRWKWKELRKVIGQLKSVY